jgi:hypothetical protein
MLKTLLKLAKGTQPTGETTPRDPDQMNFLEHLEALRWHIIRALGAIVVVAVGVFMAKTFVFDKVILGPTDPSFITYRFFCDFGPTLCFYPEGLEIITRDISEQFLSHIKVSIWLGLIEIVAGSERRSPSRRDSRLHQFVQPEDRIVSRQLPFCLS